MTQNYVSFTIRITQKIPFITLQIKKKNFVNSISIKIMKLNQFIPINKTKGSNFKILKFKLNKHKI